MKGPIQISLCNNKVQKQKVHVAVFKPNRESFTHRKPVRVKAIRQLLQSVEFFKSQLKKITYFLAYIKEQINKKDEKKQKLFDEIISA